MQAICYHRYSSKRQDRGSSIERQTERTADLCARKGWEIVETVEDRGQSAWKGDHLSVGNLGKLRARIDAGLISPGTILVVENIDRLSRQDYRTARRWIEDVTDHDIIVAVHSPELILDRHAMSGANIGAMLQHLLEANRATAEGNRKSSMQKATIEKGLKLAREGVVYSPRAPAWLIAKKGEPFRLNEDRVAIVNSIYEWSAAGLGYETITKRLNETVPPWTQGWKDGVQKWRIGYVRDILSSPAVEGEYHVRTGPGRKPTGEVIRSYYPRIVEADLVERARGAIRSRMGSGGAKSGEAQNLFGGIAFCSACKGSVGRTLTGNGRGRRYAYLECRNARYGICKAKGKIRYDHVEASVLEKLLHLALDDTHFIAPDDIAPLASRLANARKRSEELTQETANLIAVLRKLPDSAATLTALADIEAEKAATVTEISKTEIELDIARGKVSPGEHLIRVNDVRDLLTAEDDEARFAARLRVKAAFQSLIDGIEFDPVRGLVTVRLVSELGAMHITSDGRAGYLDLVREGCDYSDVPVAKDFLRRRGVKEASAP